MAPQVSSTRRFTAVNSSSVRTPSAWSLPALETGGQRINRASGRLPVDGTPDAG